MKRRQKRRRLGEFPTHPLSWLQLRRLILASRRVPLTASPPSHYDDVMLIGYIHQHEDALIEALKVKKL